MSNKSCRRQKNKNRKSFECKSLNDVTINDYANSPDGKERYRKARSSNILREVKHLTIQEDNRAWDEKLDDFEGVIECEENESLEKVSVLKKDKRCKKIEQKPNSCEDGVDFPVDIWFLLSEYLRPEDISTFSRICKTAWHVVNTPKFWLSLYKRYYNFKDNLPERLKPKCIVRHYGLKANVVRSLFFMYPPFIKKISILTPLDATYKLIRSQCVCFWHERCLKTNRFCYIFKLSRKNVVRNHKNIEATDDISANPDEGCKILRILTSTYIPLPIVMGFTLQSVALNIDPSTVCLQLVFGSGIFCNGKFQNAGSVSITLRSVVRVCVLDWWHPEYPHSGNISYPRYHLDED